MLPESDGETVNDIINKMYQMMNRYKKGEADLSDSNSPCSSGGTVQRVSRLCRSSGIGFQKVSTVPVFLSLMKISLSCERNNNRAHNITKFIHLTLFILHSSKFTYQTLCFYSDTICVFDFRLPIINKFSKCFCHSDIKFRG